MSFAYRLRIILKTLKRKAGPVVFAWGGAASSQIKEGGTNVPLPAHTMAFGRVSKPSGISGFGKNGIKKYLLTKRALVHEMGGKVKIVGAN